MYLTKIEINNKNIFFHEALTEALLYHIIESAALTITLFTVATIISTITFNNYCKINVL